MTIKKFPPVYPTLLSLLLVFAMGLWPFINAPAQTTGKGSSVTTSHLGQIDSLFSQNGIDDGYVVLDKRGRVELVGTYRDEKELDQAFSLAQTIVGVNLVSPVTPENIKVKEWQKCLEKIFSGEVKGVCDPTKLPHISVDSTYPGPLNNKYALVVGVSRFKNGINKLEYASKDARDFYNYLISPGGGNFRRENAILLVDQSATRKAIINEFNRLKSLVKENDLVVLYFSSHGTPPDKFGGVHIVTYDSEVEPRQRIWETAITEDILRDFIRGVKAKRLVVIMDACYSNGAYAQIEGFNPSGSKSLGTDEEEGYGRTREYMSKRLLGSKDIVIDEPAYKTPAGDSKSAQGWGIVLISASDAGEKSWESDTLYNSIFTYYFLQGLKTYNGTIKESFYYSKPLVERRVREEKDNDQHPQLTPNRKEWNMSIAASGK